MQLGNRKYPTAFILGAGATRGAFSHVNINKKRLRSPLNSDFFSVAATLVRAKKNPALARKFNKLIKVFKEDLPIRGHIPTMEEAFSLLYIAKDFPDIYSSGVGRKPVAGIRSEIKGFLSIVFHILTTIEANVTKPTLYERLVDKLTGGDSLITLNYDTLLDAALIESGWVPKAGYCITGSDGKFDWHRNIPQANPRLKDVALLKLHGSLNWYVRGSYNRLAKVFESKPTKIRIDSQPRINDLDGHLRQIIPPIYGKFFAHPHWRKLWGEAFARLQRAKVLVVIGCSLSETDFHLSGFLSRLVAYRKNKGLPFEHVILVNSTTVRRRWRDVLKGSLRKVEQFPRFSTFADKYLGEVR